MKKSKFEISKVYIIRWNKYRNYKIRVCYKDSIPLQELQFQLHKAICASLLQNELMKFPKLNTFQTKNNDIFHINDQMGTVLQQ